MPTIPPPPPPVILDDDLPVVWPEDQDLESLELADASDDEEPYAIALFDYFTNHPGDLCFSVSVSFAISFA